MKFIVSIISSIYNLTLTSKLLGIFTSTYHYIKDYNNISDFFYGETFKKLIKQYLHVELKKDWIGRLYGIINPNIDIDGNFNVNSMVIEINDELSNNNEYVMNWLYKQLNLVATLFNIQNLYNYINMDIQHVGPINGDNYLIIFDIASRRNISKYFKQFIIQTLIYAIIGFGIYYFLIS